MKQYIAIAAVGIGLLGAQVFLQSQLAKDLNSRLGLCEANVDEVTKLKDEVKQLRQKLAVMNVVNASTSQTQPQSPAESNAISYSSFTSSSKELDDPFMGKKDSPLLVMAFLDYQCEPCREFAKTTLPKLKEKFFDTDKARFLLRDFPLTSHPQAQQAAAFAHCAGEQGAYWKAFELLFSEKSKSKLASGAFSALASDLEVKSKKRLLRCLKSERYNQEISDDKAEGKSIGAVGAPGFFVGRRLNDGNYAGVFIRGAQPYAVFEKQLVHLEQS